MTKNLFIFASGMSIGTIIGGTYICKKFLENRDVATAFDRILNYVYGEEDKSNIRTKYQNYSSYKKNRMIFIPDEGLDPIVLDTRKDAEEVLSGMMDLIDSYGYVTVADHWGLAGLSGNHQTHLYGWEDISAARIGRSKNGTYILHLPAYKKLEGEDVEKE